MAAGRQGDSKFYALVSFLCELAGVATLTSKYLPSVLVASAVVIAGSLSDSSRTGCDENISATAFDHHPPSLVALTGYSADQTVITT